MPQAATKSVRIPSVARLLWPGESIPGHFNTGFDAMTRVDPNWVWVVDTLGQIDSILIAAPAHGIVMLLRICSIPGASRATIVKLLRRVMHDCHDRGYTTWMVGIDQGDPAAAALTSIITKAGGRIFAQQTVFAGSTDIGVL